jgi:hypothetical protein
MSEKEKIQFIPFHAINEFMRNDFRLKVIRTTLTHKNSLDRQFAAPIDRLTRKHVKVTGFRNSVKAPVTLKAVAMVKAFEKQPQIVAAILNAWCEINSELKTQIFNILVDRGWKLLPVDIDRTKLPGFLTFWPEGDDYDVLFDAYKEVYPDGDASIDETSLMVIWLAGRLPVEKVSKSEIELPEIFPISEPESQKETLIDDNYC